MTIDRTQNAADRRVGRTHQLLFDALLELVQEKRYDKITVQEILDRANVGRSTFYAHFRDKDDLLTGNFDTVAATEMFAGVGELTGAEEATSERVVVPMLGLLQHARDNYLLYEALRGNEGFAVVLDMVRVSLLGIIDARVQELRPELAEQQRRLIGHFICEGAIAAMLYWLEHDPVTPAEEVDALLQRQMWSGLYNSCSLNRE